jgi:two-component system C4-dicarboxylate transport response regulator DctD
VATLPPPGPAAGAGNAREPAAPLPVLVCDDDARVRESLVEALAGEGLPVDTAERAVDAIQRVMHRVYGAVVLDLKMPGLGGLDAIAILKRFDPRLPVIVMTGHASYETEQAARAAGIFYYLVKPFSLQELVEAVRAALRARQAARERG